MEHTRPFGPLAHALDLRPRTSDSRRAAVGRLLTGEGHVAGTKPTAPVADARYQVVEEIFDLLEGYCNQTPVAVVLEDLHWADDSTLLAFRSMAHSLAHVPFLLVGSLRPAPRGRELDQVLDESVVSGARMLRLHSLTPREVDAHSAVRLVTREASGRRPVARRREVPRRVHGAEVAVRSLDDLEGDAGGAAAGFAGEENVTDASPVTRCS